MQIVKQVTSNSDSGSYNIFYYSNNMNIKLLFSAIMSFAFIVVTFSSFKQENEEEPWTAKQLLNPADLAKMITDQKIKQPIIFCIGPGALIKGSIDIGPANVKVNLNKFKQKLSNLQKDAAVVIYCGCCPFEHCPNIRPAFSLLNEIKFTNHKLLNLEHNIKVDWINKGYPITK